MSKMTQTTADAQIAAARPRLLIAWGLALTVVFMLMGVIVVVDADSLFTQGMDDAWRASVGASPDGTFHVGPVPMFFQYLGEWPGALFTGILLPLGLVAVGRWRSALFVFSTYLTAMGLFATGMKNLVDRPRPASDETLGLYGPLFGTDHGSFPSGHATFSAVLVVIVLALIPGARARARRIWMDIGALLMIGMVWQRTLINAHWLSDTVFGLIAGTAAGLLLWWMFWPMLQSDYGRPVWFLKSPRAAR